MRSFGKDTPEFFTFTIGDDEKIYKIPLATSVPHTTTLKFAEVAAIADPATNQYESLKLQHEFLRKYMGEVVDTLTTKQENEIFEAWSAATKEETGVTQGEQ